MNPNRPCTIQLGCFIQAWIDARDGRKINYATIANHLPCIQNDQKRWPNGDGCVDIQPFGTKEFKQLVEIAFVVGFNSRQNFYVAFEKLIGCSPSKYRISHGGKKKEKYGNPAV